jgi:hypothetical protein
MKVKLVQDSIIFISGLTKEALAEANKFVPGCTTLVTKDPDTKKVTPICMVAYAEDGSISSNGIVYDSTTEDGFMCKTILVNQGFDKHVSNEDKVKAVSESFAGLILAMNELEAQVKSALSDNAVKIAAAKESIEAVSIAE